MYTLDSLYNAVVCRHLLYCSLARTSSYLYKQQITLFFFWHDHIIMWTVVRGEIFIIILSHIHRSLWLTGEMFIIILSRSHRSSPAVGKGIGFPHCVLGWAFCWPSILHCNFYVLVYIVFPCCHCLILSDISWFNFTFRNSISKLEAWYSSHYLRAENAVKPQQTFQTRTGGTWLWMFSWCVPVERWLGEEVFRTDVGRSFVCTSQQTLLEGNPGRVGLVSVNFYDTQVEAFRVNMTSSKFHAIGVYSLVTGSHLGWNIFI